MLEYCYVEEGESTYEVADRLGCSKSTIQYWLRQNRIEIRDRGRPRIDWAGYHIDHDGYPQWQSREPDGSKVRVAVHQLAAVAGGAEPEEIFGSEGNHVHHKTAHPSMNIPGLLSVLSVEEHMRIHREGEWRYNENGWPILTAPDESDGFSTISVNRHETAAPSG